MVIIYYEQPKSIEVKSIFDRGGSRGNYAIFLPNLVNNPSSSKADK